MKYHQQGLLLEGTRGSFSLSHQCSINHQVLVLLFHTAGSGERKGALLEEPDNPGVSGRS